MEYGDFSYIFSGKNVVPPKVDWAPTPDDIEDAKVAEKLQI